MTDRELMEALGRMAAETGSLHCLGCGHERSCSLHGCAICRAAAERIGQLTAENAALRETALACWIPVDERLPDLETEALLRVHGQKGRLWFVGMLKPYPPDSRLWPVETIASDWTIYGWNYFVEPRVTHWMPVPADERP